MRYKELSFLDPLDFVRFLHNLVHCIHSILGVLCAYTYIDVHESVLLPQQQSFFIIIIFLFFFLFFVCWLVGLLIGSFYYSCLLAAHAIVYIIWSLEHTHRAAVYVNGEYVHICSV